jgi:hypothetical protein
MLLKHIGWEGVNRIQLAQDWVQWRALVNRAMNLRILHEVENLLTS